MTKIKIICTTLLVEKSPQALPLGAACIASALKSYKHIKDLCDIELLSFSPEDKDILAIKNPTHENIAAYISQNLLEKFMGDFDCKICLFSIYMWNKNVLERVSLKLRENNIITLAGGPEITANPHKKESYDFISTAEGEAKVPKLIEDILYKKGFLKESDRKIFNNQEDKNFQLDQLSSPYLDGTLDPAAYQGALWELARGCPFKCSYCYESKGEKSVRYFPLERIEKELDLFAEKKIPQVFVLDPTYNVNKKRAIQLIELIAKKTPNTFYYFEARAEFIDRQLAKSFTKIPCSLQIGLQSANEKVLQLVNRPFNKKQFVKNIAILNEYAITFGFDLIYGLPGESLKTFIDGIDFALSLYPNHLEIFRLSVLPGTDLYDRAKDLQLNFEKNPPYNIISTSSFSKSDLDQAQAYAKTCNLFYNEGRAVSWFNTICNCLKIKASVLLKKFYNANKKIIDSYDCSNNLSLSHKEIEKMQISFITGELKSKHLDKYINLARDLIKYNGAYSRKLAEGKKHKKEKITLNYPLAYLDSPYASDMEFFIKNIREKSEIIEV